MVLTPSFVGTNGIGGSAQTPGTNVAYAKSVSIPANSVLSHIEGFLALTDASSMAFRVGVWDDNAGAPGVLRCLSPMPQTNAILTGGTDRWWGAPVAMWFAALTTVWIGIHIFDPTGTTLAFVSGTGSDRSIASGGVWTGETGAAGVTVTNTTHDYSIRGLVIT